MSQDHAYALSAGYMLEEYRIEGVLGRGGFGMTYLAHDTHLNKRVAVKEYLPNDFAMRYAERTVGPKSSADAGNYQWGLERFLEEAQVLAGFDHPHINRVYRRFQAHGTAYLVLEYLSGETLSKRLQRTKVLPPAEAWRLFTEMLSGLEVVHRQDYVHRDIKPLNIMLREDGSSVLLDFGAARQVVGQLSKSITSLLTPGYAPIEQYDSKAADVGPWSDFYALGVTAYCCVTGVSEGALLDATTRMLLLSRGEAEQDMRPAIEAARGGYDRRLLRAIDGCMKVDGRKRPQDVGALRALLGEGSGPVPPNPPPRPDDSNSEKSGMTGPDSPQETEPTKTDNGWAQLFGVCAVLLLFVVYGSFQTSPEPIPPPAGLEVFRDTLKDGGEGPEMVVLLTGGFRMGSPTGEEDRYSDEGPQRTVTISQRIAMGRYEVTFAEYDRFVSATSGADIPDDEGWGRGSRPVINVSQADAKAYAAWLSTQTGKTYRLPSESEWEYAARAGTRTRYSWGDKIGRHRANCDGCGGFVDDIWDDIWDNHQTAPVGRFAPNDFGLFDMHGNVSEWVEDAWHNNYEGAPTDGSAWTSDGDSPLALGDSDLRGGSRYSDSRYLDAATARSTALHAIYRILSDSDLRVVRGGSWNDAPRYLRAANRSWNSPSTRSDSYGFRIVQDLNP